jgi:prophage maintenance system killer protein
MKASHNKALQQIKALHRKTVAANPGAMAMGSTYACAELLYDALDLTGEACALTELSEIFARRGLALMAEHALQKASGRLAYAAALLDLADEIAGPGAQTILAAAP